MTVGACCGHGAPEGKSQARSRSLNLWKKSIAALTRLERDFKRGRYPQRFETEMAFASLL
jgi:hypothetical protein